ncbi:ATP-binding protein [Chitinimonas sp. BJB300]|uniref:ATP-binding protein n=1 Tax=Chitinimonas sp. BJB300 TaxID=1559339 RepID=UPI001E51C68B|nr:ATP-binding protein [Chitinimonas sp. BJB300]
MFDPAPSSHDSSAAHIVQFYDDDAFLIEEVATFLEVALRMGGAAVAIATPIHRAELSHALNMKGFVAGGPGYTSELILLDAADTLSRFMVRNAVDEAAFMRMGEGLILRASNGGRRPAYVFGEMVALLCARHNMDAAIQLEGLWGELGKRQPFYLFCGYHINMFANAAYSDALKQICNAHTHVRTIKQPSTSSTRAEEVMAASDLQQKAIALQGEATKQAVFEQTLTHREKELSEFLENATEGIHRVAADGTILWANRAELTLLGYEEKEFFGQNIVKFHVDQDLIRSLLEKLTNGESLFNQPASLRCKNGAIKHVLINSNGYFEQGALSYTRCFTRDVTDRYAREQIEWERNNLLMKAPVAAALLVGPDHVYKLANALYCQMMGRSDLVALSYTEAFPERVSARCLEKLDFVFKTGEPYVAFEEPMLTDFHGTGELEERYFKFNIEPLKKPDGIVYGLMIVAMDVTELVQSRRVLERINDERSKLLEELEAANHTKDDFLAMLGHELRNPLAPIVSALQLMKKRGDTQNIQEQAIIQRQVDHMTRLVDDLLDVSRITRGKIELRREVLEMETVLTKAVEMVGALLDQHQHTLMMDVPSTGLRCDVDPIRMAQVVANLLTNAAKFTKRGGRIYLVAKRVGSEVIVSVKDNGQGMSPEMLEHAFEPFFQGKQNRDRAEGGLGIGLALVKKLVELHTGTVTAMSDGLNQGSEFVIRLPLSVPRSDKVWAAPGDAEKAIPLARSARRILLVDDNVDAADSLGRLLIEEGHSVAVFYDAANALKALDGLTPDLVLLDIGLPGMNGYELAAKMRSLLDSKPCQFIALTGYGQESDRKKSEMAGFDHHLVKPIHVDVLLRLIA